MRLGGPARYVIEVQTESEVADAYGFARQYNLPTFVLGYGANTIAHDEGFNGVIIINRMRGLSSKPATDGTLFKIMGGEYWDDVVAYVCEKGYTGIEALSKIPGLAGAAPVQNIGAYGQEIADTLESIDVYDSFTDTYKTLSRADLKFSYRKSILNTTESGRYFVISFILKLKKGQMSPPFYRSLEDYLAEHDLSGTTPQDIRSAVSVIRSEKLPDPLEKPSSGSFFKNVYLSTAEAQNADERGLPVHFGKDGNKINSGWLIGKCGFSGQLLHGFRVNKKANLVLINESAKSYQDLVLARSEIIKAVYDRFGYWLEQEPVEIVNPHQPSANTPSNIPSTTPGIFPNTAPGISPSGPIISS